MVRLAEIVEALFDLAPPELASEGDNSGLQVGDLKARVSRAIVALDVSTNLIRQARAQRAQLAVVHHPLIFTPLKSISADSYPARMAMEAIRAGLAIVAMHTNLDYAPRGVNDRLAETLGLKEVRPLLPWGKGGLLKLVVFVPQESQGRVRRAMCEAGAGEIGNYRACSFRSAGTGTFRAQEGAHPSIGKVGRMEEVAEDRLEVLVEKHCLPRVLKAMLAAHPYEEAAYDLYPVENFSPGAGRGRVGRLPRSLSLKSLARRAEEALNAKQVRITGDPGRKITTVAVSSGSARGMVEAARRMNADALLAGEIPHHERLEAADDGLGVIELGHGPSERPAVWVLAEWLEQAFGKRLEVIRYDPGEVGE